MTPFISFPPPLEIRNGKSILTNRNIHCTLSHNTIILVTPIALVFAQVPLVNLNIPPLIQLVVEGFLCNKYSPLHLPQPLSDMPEDYLNIFPRLNGEDENTTQRHIETFCDFAENLSVEQLDVVLRLFVQSLDR